MPAEYAALLSALLALVGVLGIIIPVLPGSVTVMVSLLVWAVWGNSGFGWVAFAIGMVLLICGMTASMVLTKRSLDKKSVPQWPVTVAFLVGVVASFIFPLAGLILGFILTLLVIEWVRVKDLKQALSTSWTAVRSIGLGMLVELGAATLATSLLAVSILTGIF